MNISSFTLLLFVFMLNVNCTDNSEDRKMDPYKQNPGRADSTSSRTANYLALGDSYTIGESVGEQQRFPVQLAKMLNAEGIATNPPTIVARTGWTTADLAQGIKNAQLTKEYDLVTLLIGVNNQYRGLSSSAYNKEFASLLQTAIAFAHNDPKKVIVVSIPDYGATPFAANRNPEKIASEIAAFNAINREETRKAGANYADITPISKNAKTNAALVAADGLHPSGEMYRLWVEQIFPFAKQILKK